MTEENLLFEPDRVCSKCGESKPLSEFYWSWNNQRRRRYYKAACKTCHRASVAAYQRTDQGRANQRRHYWEGGGREQQRAYAKHLRERQFFVWRARIWSARHGTKVTGLQLAGLWLRQRGCCALSGRPLDREAHLDHVVPLSGGGAHGIDNLRWLDPWVNVARQNLSDEEFAERCLEVASGLLGAAHGRSVR